MMAQTRERLQKLLNAMTMVQDTANALHAEVLGKPEAIEVPLDLDLLSWLMSVNRAAVIRTLAERSE